MKNKALSLKNRSVKPHETEFRLVIEPSGKGGFNVYIYVEGVLEKIINGVEHYHVVTPFGADAE